MARPGWSDLDLVRDIPAMPRGPSPAADASLRARAMMVGWYPATWSAAIVYADTSAVTVVPAVGDMTDWTTVVGHPVWVLRDPLTGRSELVLGPVRRPGASASDPPIEPVLPAARALRGTPVVPPSTVLVSPAWSGTWRAAGWDTWHTGGPGGRSALHQGSRASSGRLTGLACYGERITALGASRIVAATVTLRDISVGGETRGALRLQTTEHGTPPPGAPTLGAETLDTPALARGEVRAVELDEATCEALRSGQARGLCLVGEAYASVAGTLSPDGMALRITYESPGGL